MASLIPGLLPGNPLSSSAVSVKFPFLLWVDLWLFYCFNADLFFEEKHVFLSLWGAAFWGCLCLATFFQEITSTIVRKDSKGWSGHRFSVGDHGDHDLISSPLFLWYVLSLNFYVRLVLTVPCSTLWKSSFKVAFKVQGSCVNAWTLWGDRSLLCSCAIMSVFVPCVTVGKPGHCTGPGFVVLLLLSPFAVEAGIGIVHLKSLLSFKALAEPCLWFLSFFCSCSHQSQYFN